MQSLHKPTIFTALLMNSLLWLHFTSPGDRLAYYHLCLSRKSLNQPDWCFSCDICSNEPLVGLTANCNSLPVLLCNSPWTTLHIFSPCLSKNVSPHYSDNKKINDLFYILCPKLMKLCLSEFISFLPFSSQSSIHPHELISHHYHSTQGLQAISSPFAQPFFPLCGNTPVLYKLIMTYWK